MPLAIHLFHGFLVGMAGLLPGLCGSTLLVLFGIYRPLTAALARPFDHFQSNLKRFAPFFVAAGIGILVGSRLLATVFARHETATLYLFVGFMLGALPDLFRHARDTKGHPVGWIGFAASFGACVALSFAQSLLLPRATVANPGFAAWTLAGAGIGIGSIVPGASVAFLLIFFGIYQPMLDGVARLDLGVLIPLGLGAGTAILTLAKAVDWFFRAAESFATRCVLGLVAGSIVLVFPGWPGGKSGVACILLLLLGAFLSSKLNRLAPPRNMRTSHS